MVRLVCLFMNMHLLALLRDSCLDLVRCAFLRKLFVCMRNIKTPTEANKIGRFDRYIGETQILA